MPAPLNDLAPPLWALFPFRLDEFGCRRRRFGRTFFFLFDCCCCDSATNVARYRSGRSDRCHQRLGADDVNHSPQVVGKDVQTHLGTDARQCPGLEVCRTHPRFQGSERMLGCGSSYAHAFRFSVEAPLEFFQHVFVLPTPDSPILARRAFSSYRALRTGR